MNLAKFKNVVLYICNNCPGRMTTTRLNKLLWLMDKTAFLETARTITDWSYLRKKFGPVPKDNYDALGIMKDESGLQMTHAESGMSETTVYMALKMPDLSEFSEHELQIMKKVINCYGHAPTEELVKLSHDLVWASYEDGEKIPFEAYLSVDDDINLSKPVAEKIKKAEMEYC